MSLGNLLACLKMSYGSHSERVRGRVAVAKAVMAALPRCSVEALERRVLLGGGYIMTDLGTLGGGNSSANAINSKGQIVGTWEPYQYYGPARSFLYSDGIMSDLGQWCAYDINDSGQIVGEGQFPFHACLYSDGTMIDLGSVCGDWSRATGINNRGQVVGYSGTTESSGWHGHAFLYSGGVMTDLGTLGGGGPFVDSYATDINDSGQVVGWSQTANKSELRAFLYSDGKMMDLGPGEALAINNRGQVVGASFATSLNDARPFLYSEGIMTDLGTLGGQRGEACAINSSGQVVGYSDFDVTEYADSRHIFLYSGGKMIDLHSLGMSPRVPLAINDCGQIVGHTGNDVRYQAFLASPGKANLVPTFDDRSLPQNRAVECGQTLHTTISVANEGASTATGTMAIDYYLSPSPALDNTSTLISHVTNQTVNIEWQDSSDYGADIKIPAGTKPGTYYIVVKVNPDGAIPETTLGDNIAASVAIQILQADLVATSIQWNSQDPGFDLEYEVNEGSPAAETTIQLFWSPGGTLPEQRTSASVPIALDRTGGHHTQHIPLALILRNAPSDTRYITLAVDPDNIVAEPDESNNVVSHRLGQEVLANSVTKRLTDRNTRIELIFTPNFGLTLNDAAEIVGVDHFNWLSFITSIPSTWIYRVYDSTGSLLRSVEVPITDPVVGVGLEYRIYLGPDKEERTLIKQYPPDNAPFYWNEGGPDYEAAASQYPNSLPFDDQPYRHPTYYGPGDFMGFTTLLAGVQNDGMHYVTWPDALKTNFTWKTNYTGDTGGIFDDQFSNEPSARTIDGTPSVDRYSLRLDPTGTHVQLLDDRGTSGTVLFSVPIGSLESLAVDGRSGNDLLTIDSTNGNPLAGMRLEVQSGFLSVNVLGGTNVLSVPSISVAPGATLDLGQTTLVLESGELATITSLITSGRALGLWDGPGITSSAVKLNPYGALGVRLNDQNQVLVKYTWNGDGNLDGVVNADDYFLIDEGFISHKKGWYHGDFNYDGAINADDYFLIDSAYIGQEGVLGVQESKGSKVQEFQGSRVQEIGPMRGKETEEGVFQGSRIIAGEARRSVFGELEEVVELLYPSGRLHPCGDRASGRPVHDRFH
ncbi:MAG: hypothetical protein NTU53_13635 [Planctomycetota bacterium]|nr:hypothetical protein [Planctomycetota bacterium]